MPYVFDFQNTLIEVTYPQIEVDIQDLINEIRTAEAEIVPGINFPKIANASGKETLTTVSGGTISVGITVDLQNGWQLHFWPSGYVATIAGGNLVGGPAGDPVAYSADVQVLLVQSASATLVTTAAGGGGLDQEEHDQLMGLPDEDTIASGVWVYYDRSLTQEIVASGGGLTQEEHDHLLALDTTGIATLQTSIEDVLGLTGENTRWSGMAFDSNNYLISAVITHYTDNTLSVEREKWQLTASYDSEGRITNYEFKEY